MRKKRILKVLTVLFCIFLFTGYGHAFFSYPHSNISYESSPVECGDCHFGHGDPPWAAAPVDIDDSFDNNLCQECHNGVIATNVNTHSSLQTDNGYGDWSVECITCHDTHVHEQIKTWGSASHLTSGVSTTISINDPVAGKSRLTRTSAGWTTDEFLNMLLVPNVAEDSYGYKVESNTSDTIIVKGVIDLTKVTAGSDTFAVIYGKLVRSAVTLDEIVTYTSVSTTVTETTLTETGAGWTTDEYAGMALIPNANTLNPWSYDILSNTSDTITVSPGSQILTQAKASNGDTFQIARFASKTGSKSVKFFNTTGTNSFADGDGTYDGICEVCHTQTTRHRNNSSGDHTHEAGNNCMDCHTHIDGFKGSGDCTICHNVTQPNGTGDYRRVIVDSTEDGSGSDFDRSGGNTYHHVQANVNSIVQATCEICHDQTNHKNYSDGISVWLKDRDGGTSFSYDGSANLASQFCVNCHDSDVDTPFTDSGDNTQPPDIESAWNLTFNHSTGAECLECHGDSSGTAGSTINPKKNAHASDTLKMLNASNQYDVCFQTACHSGTLTKTDTSSEDDLDANGRQGATITVYNTYWLSIPNIQSQFNTGNLAYHPVLGAGLNQPGDGLNSQWSSNSYRKADNVTACPDGTCSGLDNNFVDGWESTSIVTCTDCHDNALGSATGPHGSSYAWITKGIDTSVTVTTAGSGTVTPNTATKSTWTNRNFCLNCHRADIYGYDDDTNEGPAYNNETFSRISHRGSELRTKCKAPDAASGNKGGYRYNGCFNCHGGGEVAGIHGSNLGTGTKGSSSQGTRFMNGNSWKGYTKITTGGVTSCYTGTPPAIGVTMSDCSGQHSNGRNVNANYSY